MLSIITAVHNGIAMNRIFISFLKKYTVMPFELIIIDNNSSDGSAEFFESKGAIVIRNKANYSYPVCQNQGIKAAKYDLLVFMNNDIIVSPSWDVRLLETANLHGLDVITPVSIENMENADVTKALKRKWLKVHNPLSLLGYSRPVLLLMIRFMYGNWEKFSQKRFIQFGNTIQKGFLGHTIMLRREALEKIGLWDECIQGADFDLNMRVQKRFLETGDIKPVHKALGIIFHHYIRLTLKSTHEPFIDAGNLITVQQKWGKEGCEKYAPEYFGESNDE
jgi:GT2 family glycosyltransferase